jgi:hypothetical protein
MADDTYSVGELGMEPDWLEDDEVPTYKIVRHTFDENDERNREVIHTGLTLEEAQAHCHREDTKGNGWFDAYTEE